MDLIEALHRRVNDWPRLPSGEKDVAGICNDLAGVAANVVEPADIGWAANEEELRELALAAEQTILDLLSERAAQDMDDRAFWVP